MIRAVGESWAAPEDTRRLQRAIGRSLYRVRGIVIFGRFLIGFSILGVIVATVLFAHLRDLASCDGGGECLANSTRFVDATVVFVIPLLLSLIVLALGVLFLWLHRRDEHRSDGSDPDT